MRRCAIVLLLLAAAPVGTEPSEAPLPSTPAKVAPSRAARASEDAPREPYLANGWLVSPPPGVSLAALARAVGAEVAAPVGASGYGVLAIRGDAAREALAARGARTAPMGRIVGTGGKPKAAATATPSPDAWHRTALTLPKGTSSFAGLVVAILDSGVAYETRPGFVCAAGLTSVPIVDPLDLVEGDGHPNDDHQHGTHIASLIAGQGTYPGVAPGVSLMPIKVLDRNNVGTEWALIEGIHHAVDHGADVINLSLSFPLGYVPSLPLQDALQRADDAGIVLVAAAGNDADFDVSWPAASRLVVAVGASAPTSATKYAPASYSNASPGVDVLAPGGAIGVDRTGDGFVDGVLAETIEPGNPTRLGYWFYQGTSQAAALVSGAAVRLLAAGIAPADVPATLQGAKFDTALAVAGGIGVGRFDVSYALAHPEPEPEASVGLLPWLGADGTPHARIAVVDGDGEPLDKAVVVTTITSESGVSRTRCTTDRDGDCDVSGPVTAEDAWSFRVDTVVTDDAVFHPGKALWASDGAEVVLDAVDAAGLSYDALAVYWPAGADPVLGALAESWAVVDAGVGTATPPFALLLRGDGLEANVEAVEVDLDGSGLLSSPLGDPDHDPSDDVGRQRAVVELPRVPERPAGGHRRERAVVEPARVPRDEPLRARRVGAAVEPARDRGDGDAKPVDGDDPRWLVARGDGAAVGGRPGGRAADGGRVRARVAPGGDRGGVGGARSGGAGDLVQGALDAVIRAR